MAERRLTGEPLHVDPALIGQPLASPTRRACAFYLDLLLLALPTVAVALGATVLALRLEHPAALDAVRTLRKPPTGAARQAAVRQATRELLPLLVEARAQGLPLAVVTAVEEGEIDKAAEALDGYDFSFTLNFEEGEHRAPPKPRSIVVPLEEFIPPGVRAVALLGVPAVYFVLFTRGPRGATIGKRIFGIRVARLDGERLSWLEALERFIGYVHIPATLFLGLTDLWRDPNRRLAHDRTVHTAVFRVRRPVAIGVPGRGAPSTRRAGRSQAPPA
jgi:uncharacterized RDD family membrane protein YckC